MSPTVERDGPASRVRGRAAGLGVLALFVSACPEGPDLDEQHDAWAEETWASYATRGPLIVEPASPDETTKAPRFRVTDERNPECPGVWSIAVVDFRSVRYSHGNAAPYAWSAVEVDGDGSPEAAAERCFTSFTYGVAPPPLTTMGSVEYLSEGERFVVYVQGPTYFGGGVAEGFFRFRVEGGRIVPD